MPRDRIAYRIFIDTKKCNGCNNCTTACPINAVLKEEEELTFNKDDEIRVIAIKNGVAIVINPFRCDGCGICMIVCPQNCIAIEFLPLEKNDELLNEI